MSKSVENVLTFTSVYYENSFELAERRLQKLRLIDNKDEVKAYIIPEGNQFCVVRRIIIR